MWSPFIRTGENCCVGFPAVETSITQRRWRAKDDLGLGGGWSPWSSALILPAIFGYPMRDA